MKLIASAEALVLRGALDIVLSRVRGTLVAILIAGICGGLHPTLLDPAATLLYQILRTCPPQDAASLYEPALQQEQFKLGDSARIASAKFLSLCCTGEVTDMSLMSFAEEVWDLHQHDGARSLAESDRVVAFMEKIAVGLV